MNPTELRGDHAAELAEMLEFIYEWFAVNTDNDALAASLHRYSFGLFTLDELRTDIGRYAYLLGGDIGLLEDS